MAEVQIQMNGDSKHVNFNLDDNFNILSADDILADMGMTRVVPAELQTFIPAELIEFYPASLVLQQ
jgi:hypothetical protein